MGMLLVLCDNDADREGYSVGFSLYDALDKVIIATTYRDAIYAIESQEISMIISPGKLCGPNWDPSFQERSDANLMAYEFVTRNTSLIDRFPKQWVITVTKAGYNPALFNQVGITVQVERKPATMAAAFIKRITDFNSGENNLNVESY